MASSLTGQKAPEFTLSTSDGESFSLSDLDGAWKVLFFYARDGSPTCKRGCLTFKEQYDLFQSLTPPVEIIGISQQPTRDHEEFKQQLDLPFPILSDENRAVANAYGVPIFLGRFPAKSSFVIGPDRTIHYCYDWLFRPRRHVARILDSLSTVTQGA
tara:strand:+ start:523 stop:993 length:471 start_codon:yes stop_codon:yes gene_type:complete